jgi:tetratricopeptide (TPR) repeat protein
MKPFLLILLILHFQSVSADEPVYPVITNPDTLVKHYMMLGNEYLSNDIKAALEKFNQVIALTENTDDKKCGRAYENKAIAFIKMGEDDSVLISLDSATAKYKRVNHKPGLASVAINRGNYFYTKGNFSESLRYMLEGLRMNKELKNKNGISRAMNNIGNIYLWQKNYKKALDWYQESYKNTDTVGSKSDLIIVLNNIGHSNGSLKRYDEAIRNYKHAISVGNKETDKDELASTYVGLSTTYMGLKNYKKALENIKIAEELIRPTGNLFKLNDIYQITGEIYSEMGDHASSLKYFQLLLESSREYDMKQYRQNALFEIAAASHELKRDGEAYKYLSEYVELSDSVLNEKNLEQITEMQEKYNAEKKEKENIILSNKVQLQSFDLKNKRVQIGLLSAVIIFIVLFAILYIRQSRLKATHAALLLRQQLLRSQMNPHFLFNALSAIESFIYEKKPAEAGKYLSDFAKLTRMILEFSEQEFITLKKEIESLTYYLELQKLRMEDKFSYNVTAKIDGDIAGILIPPMLTQPFIENAIEHGLKNIENGVIEIEYTMLSSQELKISIHDNGIGIRSKNLNGHERSLRPTAIQITKERLLVINKFRRKKVNFNITTDNGATTSGTSVEFTIPV